MSAVPSPSLFERAVLQHLASVQGLRGVQAFTGQNGEWTEAARLGEVPEDVHRRVLASFDPEAGGAVDAIEDGPGGWLASYMLGGPGLDLVLILHLKSLPPAELQTKLSAIESKVGWLMVAALSDRSDGQDSRALGTEVGAQVLLEAARARSRRILADQWIARLEKAFQPGLVAVLWANAGKSKLAAVSGGGLIERQSDARGLLENLADHTIRARTPLLIAPPVETAPTEGLEIERASQGTAEDDPLALVERLGGHRALAIPVYRGDEARAVVVLVFDGSAEHSGEGVRLEAGEVLSALLGEALAIQARAYPSPIRRLFNWVGKLLRAIFGRTAWKLKLALALIALAIGAAAFIPSQAQPSFTARIDAADRRVVSSPFDGFLAEAPFQLGAVVPAGTVLVALEESDIRLELSQTQAELAEIDSELQTARAQRDAARTRLLEARRAQGEVSLNLLQRQLELARFETDRDVIVVGGDAWRRVGDRVRLGEPLLELAVDGAFRVRALVDEDWVSDLPQNAQATVLLTAYPERPIPLEVTAIGSDPVVQDGANSFPVWLAFQSEPEVQILDGMRGVVRIDVGERTVLEAYGRGALRWLRRTIWRWS